MFKNFFLAEKNMLTAIVLNAMVIFFLYFPDFSRNSLLQFLDIFFIVLFCIEALVKMQTYGFKNYFRNKWHRFDFLLVILSLPTLMTGIFPDWELNIVLLLRLFRLFRLIKFIQFVPHIGMLLAGIGRALRASILVLAILFCLNFILALFSCHFYGELVPEYFGNPLIASYSIFQMFTIEGWNEIPATIGSQMSDNGYGDIIIGFTKFFFVIIVLFGGIFGMSIANAIFVDEMTVDNNDKLEKKIDDLQQQIEEMKQLMVDNYRSRIEE